MIVFSTENIPSELKGTRNATSFLPVVETFLILFTRRNTENNFTVSFGTLVLEY